MIHNMCGEKMWSVIRNDNWRHYYENMKLDSPIVIHYFDMDAITKHVSAKISL